MNLKTAKAIRLNIPELFACALTPSLNDRLWPEAAVRSAALLTHSRLSIEVPVHLRSPSVMMVPVQGSAELQPVPRRPCRAAPSRRSRTQDQEEAAAPLPHRECASPRSARSQEAGGWRGPRAPPRARLSNWGWYR